MILTAAALTGYVLRIFDYHTTLFAELPISPIAASLPGQDAGTVEEYQLPWADNPAFLQVLVEHETPVLMAAYRATLIDPIGQEAENIELAVNRLAGTVVPPGAIFSVNRTLGPYSEENGYLPGPNYLGNRVVIDAGGGVCKIATMLYNLTILANLQVVFRQAHTMIVPYVPPGQDATVSYSAGPDYQFRNNTSSKLLIWGAKVGPTLYMAFYGTTKPPRVIWRHKILSHVPATTVIRINNTLAAGEERQVWPGVDGYTVRSWAEIIFPDKPPKVRNLGVSHYRMSQRIIERGR